MNGPPIWVNRKMGTDWSTKQKIGIVQSRMTAIPKKVTLAKAPWENDSRRSHQGNAEPSGVRDDKAPGSGGTVAVLAVQGRKAKG